MKTVLNCRYLVIALFMLVILPRCSHDVGVVQNVNPSDAAKLIKSNNNNPGFMIMDVRTPGEFASGHLQGAINLDLNNDAFESKTGQLDKSKTYLVYCRSGHRSSKAVSMMKEKGFKSLKNLDGGISQWIEENLPVVLN